MKKLLLIGVAALMLLPSMIYAQGTGKYTYDTVPGDPLKARIYTLSNGLKVYISVYKDEPRFQSMIGVKAGSKNDPADHTGLAHYLEHMLFKGTDKYGTSDYAKEAPLLDTIFNLYDQYGATTDAAKRSAIYHRIDSVSGEAAKYAIPNEFDKMMGAMGVTGTNAFTSVEQTVYVNNVPSNQFSNFITVEAERFRKPVMRLFHTELEAVYEEKNRALDNDNRKVFEALYAGLFQHHQYGTQTTIGTIEHLKSPSLKEIKNYLDTYYVPNNMVISLSGDLDPDMAIRVIDEKFGSMPAKDFPSFSVPSENLIKQPVVKEVFGPDAENVAIGFRFGGASTPDADMITMVDMILSNGQAGLLDLNLNNAQKVLSASSGTDIMKDYSVHLFFGKAREGQSLEQVRDLLLGQIMEIKNGNFPDWLIPAIVTNMRADQARNYESNQSRASEMLDAEVLGIPYKMGVTKLDRLAKINKQQVIDFVRKWYGDNYVIVYKRTGEDKSVAKVIKPAITPVATNSDKQSHFVADILASNSAEVNPVFIDFSKAVQRTKLASGVTLYSTLNKVNDLFELKYVVEMGSNHDRKLPLALQYLSYLGTKTMSSSKVQEEFYKIGCSFDAGTTEDETYISLSGINKNLVAGMQLLEGLLHESKGDTSALANLKDDIIKARQNAKLNKNVILSRMQSYAKYGPVSPATYILSEAELMNVKSEELVTILHNVTGYTHRVDYYGPSAPADVVRALDKFHKVPKLLQAVPSPKVFTELPTDSPKVFVVNYAMQQSELVFLSKGAGIDTSRMAQIALYNRYFGGSMESPVFQTLRESKALAYAVASRYMQPQDNKHSYYNYAYIGCQVDKMPEAMEGMMDLLRNMPVSEKGLDGAKKGLEQQIRSDRITKSEILNTFHRNEKLGLKGDTRQMIYKTIPTLRIDDVKKFQSDNLSKMNYTTIVLGNSSKLDMETLKKYGPVTVLELKDIFGY